MSADFNVTPIRGAFRVLKAGRRRDTTYDRFGRAEAAAARLVETNPDDAFIVTQEVARVVAHRKTTDG